MELLLFYFILCLISLDYINSFNHEPHTAAYTDKDYKFTMGDEFIFMEILNPTELRYTYKLSPSTYTPSWNMQFSGINLIVSDPLYGCGSYLNNVKDKIVFVQRGECSFFSKGIKAQEAGALGILISDNNFENDDNYYNMEDDFTERKVEIPMAFLEGKSSFKIRNVMVKNGMDEILIRIPVNISNISIENLNLLPWLIW
ncbi:unnamed protein product [Lepeophtheirus salmonis]|uniref:(salmon louse) hypothetical protein n=1 Tax=Lepeophtheirus salmonis TaxID=72036 RepID=D3PHG4_LEPSM|nr:Protease-associated domain-containing protein of 21 kDa [Lepeophtheirus salmonis]CAB4061674.1 unnamed protein product [Lepeophtheirus salmonis]CAF2888812.1 unnamed protein product [Lepeophtheirus salmonis]